MTLLHIKVYFAIVHEHKKTGCALDSIWGFLIKSSYWAALLVCTVTVAGTGHTEAQMIQQESPGHGCSLWSGHTVLQLVPVPTVEGKTGVWTTCSIVLLDLEQVNDRVYRDQQLLCLSWLLAFWVAEGRQASGHQAEIVGRDRCHQLCSYSMFRPMAMGLQG